MHLLREFQTLELDKRTALAFNKVSIRNNRSEVELDLDYIQN